MIAAGGLVWWKAQGPEHLTTEPLSKHAIAQTASDTAWEWDPPEGAEVFTVRPIPSGVAVQLDDGVVALDGVTGEPTWRYRRADASLSAASTTPDTRLLALAFEKEQQEEQDRSDPALEDLLVLDTSTGEIVGQQEIGEARPHRIVNSPVPGPRGATQHLPASGIHQVTNDARIELGARGFVAYSLTEDSELWENGTAFPRVSEDDAISDSYTGQTAVSGDTVVSSRLTVNSESRHDWTYEVVALDARTGEVRWEGGWSIGDGRGHPDPTFTLGPDSLALRLYPEEEGLLLDLESGEEIVSGLWPEEGDLIALTGEGYVSVNRTGDDRGVLYFGRDGEVEHQLEPNGVSEDLDRTLVLPTTEAFIALGPDPDDPDRGVLTVDDWASGTRQATLDAGWVPGDQEALGPSIGWSAEPTPFLRQVPGAIVALNPATGGITAFTP